MENPASLLRRLNPYCARAMEGAASLCQTRTHAKILPGHWLLASLAGEQSIRSVHLLMALGGKPNLARCDGLWPLLTLGQSQLDAQSDERPDLQPEVELAQGIGLEFDLTEGEHA
ncbi:Clp protease [Klebsiella michiganensis]|nr:Clp protease [Klebsiella michiganensis]